MDYESKTPVPTVTATSMAKESDNSTFYTKMNSEVKNDSTTSANNTKNIDPKCDEFGKNETCSHCSETVCSFFLHNHFFCPSPFFNRKWI